MKAKFWFTLILTTLIGTCSVLAQTSWKGTVSTDWQIAANWTSGVPTAATDAIIGDASFTGSFQPNLTGVTAMCKNLEIGTGSIASQLSITKNINVAGNLIIGSNGTILHNTLATIITVKGNWTNSGTYNATASTAQVTFSGAAQTLTGATTFKKVMVNSGSTLTLANNIIIDNNLSVSGTVEPTAAFAISGLGTLTANSGSTLHVKASTFTGNYALSGAVSLHGASTINYSSTAINQTISNTLTYGYLRVSGGTIKSLEGNLPALISSANSYGRIYIDAGTTLDLLTFTANRGTSVTGGSLTMSATSKLKIGGTNGFPSNYQTIAIASTSTVEYCGNNQTVASTTYGNLTLSSTAGAVVKTFPGSAFTISGNLYATPGTGTSVTFTAGNKITVNKDVILDASTTFNGSSSSHSFIGNWTNNGTFNGNTSTVTFNRTNAVLSGTGTNNFNNLTFSAPGITCSATTNLNVSGNLNTTGSGTFVHSAGGTVTMTGTSKSISGNGFKFDNLTLTGTISTASNIQITGNFIINGSFNATHKTVTLSGTSKTFGGSGTITFNALSISGTITTADNFALQSNLSVAVSASLSASAGTATISGNSVLSGTADLFNVTINGGKTLRLGTNSILGIGGVFTKTGTLNVTSSIPNTVRYNSSGNQNIINTTYNNLIVCTGGTKTASGNISVNNDFTIGAGTTFQASTYTMTIYRHWTNNGTFTAGTSTIQFFGSNVSSITGSTAFNNLTVSKSSSAIWNTLTNNISVVNLTMTTGNFKTFSNSITITGTRTGNGLITGTITHTHAFAGATPYYFEGPNNAITFTSPSGITEVTVKVTIGSVSDFNPGEDCITREYEISIPVGTYTNATFRMHYENNEMNAFDEPNLTQYHYTGINWDDMGFTTRSTSNNYVEKTGITSLTGRWTLSGIRNVVRWNGSVSSDWENAANWTTVSGVDMSNRIPNSTDNAEIGTGVFAFQPIINSTQTVNIVRFGSAQAGILTINSGSLTTAGGVRGIWSTNRSHILNVSAGSLIVGTNMELSDGVAGHDIQLQIGAGSVSVLNDLYQNATGSVVFTGNGNLSVTGDYKYTAGTFTAGSGTVTYTGNSAQVVAHVTYFNLSFSKPTESAFCDAPVVVNGDLTLSVGGEVIIEDTLRVIGNVVIGSGTTLTESGVPVYIGGNWTNNGTFVSGSGQVIFNGTSNQNVNSNTFNTLVVTKTSGSLILTGDLILNSDITLNSGTMDLSTFTADRSNPGGTLTLGSGSLLKVGGAANFPNSFITMNIATSSTVEYYGSIEQNILDITYGNLTLSNGGSAAKIVAGNMVVNGDLLINAGATMQPDSNSVTLYGNFTNNGTFTPGTSTLILNGTSKSFSGAGLTTVYTVNVLTGSYTITGGNLSMTGDLFIDATGYFHLGTSNSSLDGDLTNKGSLISNGISTFTGTRVQTLQLLNAITSSSTGVINYNGTVPPIINSTSSPSYATVNINNTGGITASVPWTVYFACNIAPGATFDGGALTHTFYGNFTNNGTVRSSGEMKFTPALPFSAAATVTLDGTSFVSTGTVEFGGSSALTIVANNPSFTNIKVTNVNASGITFPTSWTIANNLFIGNAATLHAGTALNHTVSGTYTNNGTLDGGTSTITFNGNPESINGLGTNNFYNLTIATGADITINKGISIYGNFVDNGIFTATGRTVTFAGTGNSLISGTAPLVRFDYMDQNKTGGAITTLNLPVELTGGLILTNGIVNTSSTNLLTLNDNSTSTEGSASSFVNGPMKKIGDEAFVFPVGDGSVWARIGISAPTSPTTAFQAEYNAASYANTSSLAAPLTDVSRIEHWILDRTAGADNVVATLYWEDGNRSGVDNLSDIVVARFDGSNWQNETQDGGVTGTLATGTVSSRTISSFSPFTLGSLSLFVNPLPVVLVDFTATSTGQDVVLNWSTANESGAMVFEIEKSLDGQHFEKITAVNGKGSSNAKMSYMEVDEEVGLGYFYYRLKEKESDGSFVYSQTISIEINASGIVVYPNPLVAGQSSEVSILGTEDDETVMIELTDITGNIIESRTLSAGESRVIAVSENLVAGNYLLAIRQGDTKTIRKIVVQ